MSKSLRILGIRGVPAAHGGFETFAEYLSLYLVEKGWNVTVYCQEDGHGKPWTDSWEGITRVHFPVSQTGPAGTIAFDLKSTLHAAAAAEPCLILGYNTAVFMSLLRLRGIPCLINMDGIEWARAKWGSMAKLWFWMNDWAGCWLGTHLIADHPEIKRHLSSRARESKITTIPYGAPHVLEAETTALEQWGLQSGKYLTVIARPEPENSILEIVQGFSSRSRDLKLLVLGNYDRSNSYQASILDAASDDVIFAGAIYDGEIVRAIRYHCLAYVHGHQVGGTNPSLVEALGAGNAVIAHDNRFNRWVAGDCAEYFTDAESLGVILNNIDATMIDRMQGGSRRRFQDGLTWPQVLSEYELLIATHTK
ncbi:DUF1972 domain-containing protein [Stenotrophomonas tumulicola]|uniref:DUF1972 domain-containing protein n=1 Tax=Stenotrophomonas tumulicola TaxID=1685415 RepID=A0A7W3FPW2_9GAMM|nr:DUF1972 domain-containing protein [Stenotrophomonas tumulicola]MBA8683544.1 DUF1972 domain-containing protein [Stenotrophomonas tumulicola]